jgi:hypothetical protein
MKKNRTLFVVKRMFFRAIAKTMSPIYLKQADQYWFTRSNRCSAGE